MRKINSFFIILILSACTPQVTVTSTATILPPTQTPIPTPTLHPDFIALQNLISDSSNLVLLPDGTIEDSGVLIPNLLVDQNGIVNLIINNEHVAIEQSQISFDDENVIKIKGYELNDDGEWVEAVNPAEQVAVDTLDKAGIDSDTYTMTQTEDGTVIVTNNETSIIMIKSAEFKTQYDIELAIKLAGQSCESTEFKPNPYGLMPAEYGVAWAEYATVLTNDFNYRTGSGVRSYSLLLDKEDQCWGFSDGKNLLYRDKVGEAHKLQLIPMSQEELAQFYFNGSKR